MENTANREQKKKIERIEDRKIEILMEIASINKEYDDQVTRLNSEYQKLHKELYMLQVEMIRTNN